jgi:hypothetical protein
MTDVPRLASLRCGIHSSTADYTTAPGTLRPLELRGPDVPGGLFPRSRAEIDRPLVKADGSRVPFVWGAKNIGAQPIPLEFRGVNNNDGSAVADWEAKLEAGFLLQSFFGAVAPATVGAAPTASGVAGLVLTASTNVILNNELILFTTTTGVFARRVISGGGTTSLTLDRAFTGTPSGPVRRAARYTMSPGVTEHTPVFLDAEGTTIGGTAWRQQLFGCFPQSMVITMPDTGLVQLDMTFLPNDWAQPAAAAPGVLVPTAGAPVMASSMAFYDGADLLDISSAKLTVNIGGVMKPSASGPNGVKGGVAANKRDIMLEGDLYLGGLPGEKRFATGGTPLANADTGGALAAGTVATTRSLLLQCGLVAGGTLALWLPEAAVISTIVPNGDFLVERFVARATGAIPLIVGAY